MEENKKYYVYMHINKINDKKYVGQTCRIPEYRWNNGEGYINNSYFYRAIQKYGWDNFDHIIIESNLTKEDADILEIHLIDKFETTNRNKGYNLKSGGSNGIPSEESRKKMSDAHRGKKLSEERKRKLIEAHTGENHWNYGKHLSEEHKAKIQEAFKKNGYPMSGKHHSDETKQKIREANTGKRHSEESKRKMSEIKIGKKLSEETKRKIGKANKGRKHTAESKEKMRGSHKGIKSSCAKKVSQFTKDGVFVKSWDCISDASNELNINGSHIGECCRGESKTAGNYIWRYADEPLTEEYLEWCNKKEVTSTSVVQYTKDGEFIKIWESIAEAKRLLNISSGISECCRKKRKSAGGYIWRYYEDIKDELEN